MEKYAKAKATLWMSRLGWPWYGTIRPPVSGLHPRPGDVRIIGDLAEICPHCLGNPCCI